MYLAAQQPAYAELVNSTIQYARNLPTDIVSAEDARVERAVEYLAVLFGTEIYHLTGRVSTEVDVRHSFNTSETIKAALRIIELYKAQGVPKEAVRIKISATWEGIQAGRILEREHGVSVLITIVFGMVQAITAAEAGVTCIAPYVGRIGDWFRAHQTSPSDSTESAEDMGVTQVRQMQNYLRKYNHRTHVMGASFRNTEQVKALAGVDLLTIAPSILENLESDSGEVVPQVTTNTGKEPGSQPQAYEELFLLILSIAQETDLPQVSYINDENAFRWAFNNDSCAVEKSADAMRRFADDTERLKVFLAAKLIQ